MFVARSASEILDEIRRIKGLSSDAALGEEFGVKQSTVSSWRARNSLPYEEIIAFCIKEGISTDSLLLHQRPVRISKEEKETPGRSVTITIDIDDLFTTRLIRELGDRTVEWLSRETCIDFDRISSIVRGFTVPTFDELESIADTLQVNIRWLAEKSPHPSENWMYEFYFNGHDKSLQSVIFKSYLIAAENCIEKMQGLIKLSPKIKADVIATACRVHMKETPNSTEINHELIRYLLMLPR